MGGCAAPAAPSPVLTQTVELTKLTHTKSMVRVSISQWNVVAMVVTDDYVGGIFQSLFGKSSGSFRSYHLH
jgi:hypothetical protein